MFLHYCPDLHTCEMSLDKHWLASSGLGTPCAIRPVPGGYHGSQSLRGAWASQGMPVTDQRGVLALFYHTTHLHSSLIHQLADHK
jgi:hypothetical protein